VVEVRLEWNGGGHFQGRLHGRRRGGPYWRERGAWQLTDGRTRWLRTRGGKGNDDVVSWNALADVYQA
jgi:hypothetical protein